MKPTPDESSEIEPPITRADFPTDAEGAVDVARGDSGRTTEGETRRIGPDIDQPEGQVGDLPTLGSSGISRRGTLGRIEPGQTLYSKYLVLRKLGGGAMGDVWLVRHAMLKSQHALKVIVPNFATNAVALMRFQREFEVMATLRHEHAVIIYDACIDDDGGYIDMEYVEGQTIHEILSRARERQALDPSAPLMPLDWIVRVLDQLCEVLQAAHDKGIVHRDLKPSNMMLLGGRKPGKEYLKVLDFGIAKVRDDPEGVVGRGQVSAEFRTEGFIGTPSYGSPEQVMGLEVDGRADLYTVGIMLYEFVTGRLPFRGGHWQVMQQIVDSNPPPFAESNPQLRPLPELEQAIFRVMAKDREQRPRTARELYDEIRRAVEAVPPSTLMGDAGPPTDLEGFGGEPLSTQVATLVAKSEAPGWKAKAIENPSDLGVVVGIVEASNPPVTFASRFRSNRWAILGLLIAGSVGLLLLVVALKETYDAIAPSREPNSASLSGTIPRKPSVDFERYWPESYHPVEGYTQGMPWPEKVRRSSDEAVFLKFADGIYLPESFDPENKADLVDGWPRVIVKEGIRFIRLPGDTWVMGAWDAPNAVDRADAPAHPVRLTGFYLQEFEVTHGQVEKYLDETLTTRPTDWAKTFTRLKQTSKDLDIVRRHPASNVSHNLAEGFGQWFGGQLPTEAQWEYAARSLGRKRRYVWGDSPTPSQKMANVDSLDMTTSPVGSYPKDQTLQGIFDLTGNVQEMCRDAWLSTYSKTDDAVLDPCVVATDPVKTEYSIRGGAFDSIADECPTTRRDDKRPAVDVVENLGFRLVVECPDTRKPK